MCRGVGHLSESPMGVTMSDEKSGFEQPRPYSVNVRTVSKASECEDKWVVVMAYNLVEAELQVRNKLCRGVSPAPRVYVISSAPLGLQDDGVMG